MNRGRRLVVSAPGRLCLFGEHQDYLGLPVIAAAIDRRLTLSARATAPGSFRLALPDVGRTVALVDRGVPLRYRAARDYFRSVYNTLLAEGLRWPSGWRGSVRSEIPINAGTSSSTALSVAWTRFLLAAAEDRRGEDAEAVARLAHRAEVVEFGEPGGIMDHFACALGGVLAIDSRRRRATRIDSATHAAAGLGTFVLGHSLEPKDTLATLAQVKGTVLDAVARMREVWRLFDLASTPLDEARERLGALAPAHAALLEANLIDRDLLRIARSVLETHPLDHARFGALLTRHQEQLRRRGVSTRKIERLLEAALAAGAFGGKLNGSGGGGCLFAYVPERAEEVAEAMRRAGGDAWIVRIDDGVRVEATG